MLYIISETTIQFSLTFLLRPTLLRPAATSSPTLSLLSLHHNTIYVRTHRHSHGDRCTHTYMFLFSFFSSNFAFTSTFSSYTFFFHYFMKELGRKRKRVMKQYVIELDL